MISAFRSQDHRIQAEFEAPDNSNTVGVMSGYRRGQRACPGSIGYLAEPILRICRRYSSRSNPENRGDPPLQSITTLRTVIEPTLQTGVAALVRSSSSPNCGAQQPR